MFHLRFMSDLSCRNKYPTTAVSRNQLSQLSFCFQLSPLWALRSLRTTHAKTALEVVLRLFVRLSLWKHLGTGLIR
jgi:hypothetical protein